MENAQFAGRVSCWLWDAQRLVTEECWNRAIVGRRERLNESETGNIAVVSENGDDVAGAVWTRDGRRVVRERYVPIDVAGQGNE